MRPEQQHWALQCLSVALNTQHFRITSNQRCSLNSMSWRLQTHSRAPVALYVILKLGGILHNIEHKILWNSYKVQKCFRQSVHTRVSITTTTQRRNRLTEADKLTIWLGATPSGLTSAHLHHPHIFHRPDAIPAAQPTVSKHWRLSVVGFRGLTRISPKNFHLTSILPLF